MNTKNNYIRLILVALVAMSTIAIQAKQGPGGPEGKRGSGGMYAEREVCDIIPDLTDEQQAQIKELKAGHMKEASAIKLDIEEKRVQLKKLMIEDSPDMKSVESKLDELFELKKNGILLKIKHHQEVRSLLTDEQKVVFDMKKQKMLRHGKGHGHDLGYGHGWL